MSFKFKPKVTKDREATEKESQELVDEGIALVKLPFSKNEKNKN